MTLNDILNGKINEESKEFLNELSESQRNAIVDIFNVDNSKISKVMDTLLNFYNITPYFNVEFTDVDRVSIIHIGFSLEFIPILDSYFDFRENEGNEYLVYNKYDMIVQKNIYEIITNQSSLDEEYKENLMNIDNEFFQILNDNYYTYLDGIVEKFGIEFFRDNIKYIPSINFDDEGKFDNLGVRLICVNTTDEVLTKFSDVLDLDWTPFEDDVTQIIYSV